MARNQRKPDVPSLVERVCRAAGLQYDTEERPRTLTRDQLVHLGLYLEEMNKANAELKSNLKTAGRMESLAMEGQAYGKE
jgi:hypothetical protein